MAVIYFIQQDFLTGGTLWEGDQNFVFHAYENFLESKINPTAMIIGYKDSILAQQLLFKLRANKAFCLTPMFTEVKVGGVAALLADGVAPSPCVARRKAQTMQASLHLMQSLNLNDQDLRLLGYLYSRQETCLMPIADWHTRGVYYYPLLRALSAHDTDEITWLDSMSLRGLIHPSELIDKVRFCQQCNSAHLNYIEVCPVCTGINIGESKMSDDEGERACHQCKHHFQAPKTMAKCMACHYINHLEQLITKSVHSFTISEVGVQLLAAISKAKELGEFVISGIASHQHSKLTACNK